MAGPGSGGPEGVEGGKSRFDDIYCGPDPRAYFRRLAPLEYEIPHHAQPVFRQAATERAALDEGSTHGPAVLDVCCSYGINAALLNHDVTLAEMCERYTSPGSRTLSTAELRASDKAFYAARRRPDPVPVFGLDVSAPAVQYALEVGLLDAAFTDDLEQGSPSPRLRSALADVGLITLTGGGSYVTVRTFTALLTGARRPVWVDAFVLRTVSYQPIARTLAVHGLTTTVDVSRTYPQRLFTDEREQRYAIAAVRALGGDPTAHEENGRFYTLHYESRPDAPRQPVSRPHRDGGGAAPGPG
ncbi:hypothetical protein [Streptomyces tropicalis]|uniref:Methyltransferase type 12 n=1 Tax=Streptomyces tropicalis TaxID=3034234 RepID=A0ABT6A4R4_9ACTN|nr:hypothetical protein [Streptomyces tropicalis]MDF3299639.1 hypothetical protein [Streptomyces tropicalis]